MEYILHPKSEIDSRIRKLKHQMDELDGVLLLDAVDMCYFSGTAQDGLVYIPRDSTPVVLIRKSLERAREESPLDVLPLKSLKDLRSELGIVAQASIGLELDVLPVNSYARLTKALGDAKIVDVSESIKHLRSIKSDFEIDLIKEAARLVDIGIASVPDHLVEGMKEIELASRVESAMKEMGHQGTARFRRFNHLIPLGHLMSGPNAAVPSFLASPTGGRGTSLLNPQGPGFRRIRRKEPIFVDFAGVYNGYCADETRIFSIGGLSQDLEDAHLAALSILGEMAKELSPGKTGQQLFDLSEALGADLGFEEQLGGPPGAKCGFVGHGIGLEIDEYPVLGPVDHKIELNMTIAVEPKMIYPGLGVVGIEDTFLTTAGKAHRLTKLPQEIWRV